MKVLVLEHPRIRSEKRFNDIANTPLWSCLMGGYAAANLKQAGFDAFLLDAAIKKYDYTKTKESIFNFMPQLICINAVYMWEHTDKLFNFISSLKHEGFRGHISLFGFFPTLAYQVILENISTVDSIAVGECESTLTELAIALNNNH